MPDPTLFEDNEFIYCVRFGCDQKVKNHRWGVTKAEGWFFSRYSGFAYCPEHLPDWVEDWRKRKARENG